MSLPAFEIVSAADCARAFANAAPPTLDRALPVTVASWRSVYHRQLPEQPPTPVSNNPWWMDLEITNDMATSLLWVTPDLPCFAGHFPGQPILPGVLQLEWGVQLANLAWPEHAADTAFAGTARVKFKAPVLPNALLQLKLSRSPLDSKSDTTRINLTLGSASTELTTLRLLYRV